MADVSFVPIALLVLFLVMLVELLISRAHERTLRAQGAVEPSADVYRMMQWVYPGAFVAMGAEGMLSGRPPGRFTIAGIALLLLAKAVKYWAIATLGTRWTFRVLVPPGAPLIRRGPYRLIAHPNYVGVIGELVAFALLAGAPITGIVSTIWFGALLRHRIRVEEQALHTG